MFIAGIKLGDYLLPLLPFDAKLDCGAGFNELIVPRAAEWLAKFKSGGTDPRNGAAGADEVINFYRSQVTDSRVVEPLHVTSAARWVLQFCSKW